MTDIKDMSADDLKQMKERIQAEEQQRIDQARSDARTKIQAILKESGMSLAEVFPGRSVNAREVKYRDPENSDNIWVGAGRRPAWLNEKIKAGSALESFEVKA